MPDEPEDISIPYLFLADGAEAVGGKLYVLGGGWDGIMIPNLPAHSIKPFALAIGIKIPYSHTNRKFALTIELIDADGTQIGDVLRVELESGRPPGMTQGSSQSTPRRVRVLAAAGCGRDTRRACRSRAPVAPPPGRFAPCRGCRASCR